MDHSEASRLMASEKYLLNELSSQEMEAFEEHLFACQECALDVRAGSVFLEQAKLDLANFTATPQRVPERAPSRGFSWWRPAFAAFAMAVLLIIVGYQNFVTYPSMKAALAQSRAPRILPAVSLVSGETRGGVPATIDVAPGKPFLLPVDIQSQSNFQSYVVQLRGPSGGIMWSLPVSSELTKNTVTISVPGVDQAGSYAVVVSGRNAQGESSEVGHYPFDLQFARAANPKP